MPNDILVGRRCVSTLGSVVIDDVATANPQHEWFAGAHEAAPPVFGNHGFNLIPTLFELGLKPNSELPPVHTGVDLLVFAGLYLKQSGSKPVPVHEAQRSR